MGILCDCAKTNNMDSQIPEDFRKTSNNAPLTAIGEDLSASDAIKSNILEYRKISPAVKYNYVKPIGEGAHGKVFLVQDKVSKELRAIKTFKKSIKTSFVVEQRIESEMAILEKIDHPHVIKIYEYYSTQDNFYFVSDYCKGGTLSKLYESEEWKKDLTQKKYKSREIKTAVLMFQMLSAINYCHNINVMHRDLKPNNIMLDDKKKEGYPNVKLIDFGTAKIFYNYLQYQFVGTPHYVAPEIIKGEGYNEKVDLWSSGVIMYLLLSGRHPFEGKTASEIYDRIKLGRFDIESEPFNNFSDPCKDLLKKLFKQNPSDRVSAGEALEHNWFEKNKIKQKITKLDIKIIKRLLENIKKYNPENPLQKPVIAYLIHNNIFDDFADASTLFMKIDINNDGTIGRAEFIDEIVNLVDESGDNVDFDYIAELFDTIDSDKSGEISFREFLCASIEKKKLLKEEILVKAFNFFDKDKNGNISVEEIKKALVSQGLNEKDSKEVLDKVDLNKTGNIDIEEFKKMMGQILS